MVNREKELTILIADEISKSYGAEPEAVLAVDRVSFKLEEGKLLVLLGESGCGKTTILKIINRLIEPSAGKISINGQLTTSQDPIALRRSIGYVFQNFALFPHMTVAENIGITLNLEGQDQSRIDNRIDDLLDLVHLDPSVFRNRWPQELSGGQKQRVALIRALAPAPNLVLADEPFGALDPITRDSVKHEFQDIQKSLGFAAILVTHDMTEALTMADEILILQAGKMVQIGTPHELLTKPATPYVEHLISTPKRQTHRLNKLLQ